MTEPSASAAFRETLSRFASGVVVVVAHTPDGPVGMTASAFASVSLDPPLVLVCVAHRASSHEGLVSAPSFGISVLSRPQEWIAEHVARRRENRFAGIEFAPFWGAPVVAGALAQMECTQHARHNAGDHTILVGRVVRSAVADGALLVHFHRRYGDFTHVPPVRADAELLLAAAQAAARDDLVALRAVENEAS